MEGSESSINRIGRTIWTVWGYLSGAVGRYLKPEVSTEAKQNGEETVTDVTVSKSYKELKENEEEKDRSETKTWAQNESPQSGVRVRIAAVQWEKASIRKGVASKHTGTGVAWNTGVQEGCKEDRKAHEQRNCEGASDNNNKEVRTKNNDFYEEEAFVDAPAFISAGKGGQDFVDFRSGEAGIYAERSENVICDSAEKAAVKTENSGQCVVFEEPTIKCFEAKESVREVLDEKEIKHTEILAQNEENADEKGSIWRTTEEDEDEAYTSRMADDLGSLLTCSTKQEEDLLKDSLHQEPKEDGKHREEATESKSERKVTKANDVKTKNEIEGNIQQEEQGESIHDDVDYDVNQEEAQNKMTEDRVATACELLEQPDTAQVENGEKEMNKRIQQESEKEDTNDETIIKDEYHHAGQQLIVEKLNVCESKQNEIQFGFTEGIVGIGKELDPVSTITECEATATPETERTKAIKDSKHVTKKERQCEVGQQSIDCKATKMDLSILDEAEVKFTEEILECKSEAEKEICELEPEPATKIAVNEEAPTLEREPISIIAESMQVTTKDVEQHETGLELSEFLGSEIANELDNGKPKLDETQTVLSEEMAETESEPLQEPATGQMENVEIYGKEPEPEQEPEPQAKQLCKSKFAEIVDLCESKLDESPIQFSKEREKEEPATVQMENTDVNEKDLEPLSKSIKIEAAPMPEIEGRVLEELDQVIMETVKEGQHEAGLESSELIGSAYKLAIHESKLDETQTVFTEKMAETECEALEEPAAGPMENVEIYGKEPEPVNESTENEAASTPETEPVNVIKESIKVTMEISEDELQLGESKFAKTVDQCESKLDEFSIKFTKEKEKTKCDLSKEPATVPMEVCEKDVEAFSKSIENESVLTVAQESIKVLEESEKAIVGTRKEEQHEAGLELRECTSSAIADKLDIYELDETQPVFTEEMAESECEPLEKLATRQIDNIDIYGKEPEPVCEIKANVIKEEKLVTLQTIEDEEQKAKQRSDSKFAEVIDLCESKPNEGLTQFTEERERTECDLSLEVAKVHEKDLKPSSKDIENEAVPTPESEAIDVFLVATTQEFVVTKKSGRPAADQYLLGELIGSGNTEKLAFHGAKLHETRSELSEGMGETECEPSSEVSLMKVTFNDESLDRGTDLSTVVKEADQLDQPDENKEAGTTSDITLKTEVERLGDTICDIYGSQIPEKVIKQDSESVIALRTEGPGNQIETTEFQQKVRAEVAADVVKTLAELESLHEQPKSSEHLALQDTISQSILDQESLQIMSVDEKVNILQLPEEQISNMLREKREIESGSVEQADEIADESVDELPSSSPQELNKTGESVAVGVKLLTGLTAETKYSFTAQEVEVLEANTELTAVSDRVVTKTKCEKAEFEMDASKTESESTLAAVVAPETIRRAGASVPGEMSGIQSLLNPGDWTVQDRSAVEPHGHQMGYSGELSLPEHESALETSDMQKDSQKCINKNIESPDEAEAALLDEKQVMVTSLGVMEQVMSGLKQEFEKRQSPEKGLTKTMEACVEASDPNPSSVILQMHSELSDSTVEDRQNLQIEEMDIGSDACGKTEPKEEDSQNVTGDDVELLAEGEKGNSVNEEKAVDEKSSVVDSNGNFQERSRPGLKRVFEKMAREEEDKPSAPKDWAGASHVLQQVSSLDCTVQKAKIAVKNPHVRPPKDPRTLINKASVEPLAPTRPSQPSPLKKVQAEGLIMPQKGVQQIGLKLPGLGAGFPALRKTDAGRKIRDEGETQSVSTQPVQKSDTPTETKEDCVKQEQPANKPKWTPPRLPGMGNPLMMSELKSKLKKTGKE